MKKNSEYKVLFECWRRFLNENSQKPTPSGMSIINKIKILESYIQKCKSKSNLVIRYTEDSYNDCILNIEKHPDLNIQGSIEFEKTPEGWPLGYAHGGYRIRETHQTTKGFGPLLYEIIIEKVSELGSFLMSDRNTVSSDALNVWNVYNSRSDIKKIQLDINTDESEALDIDQITPANVSDDTSMEAAVNDKGNQDWRKSALSKGYSKEIQHLCVLDYLRQSKYIDFIDEIVDEI